MFRAFRIPLILTAVALTATFIFGGPNATFIVAVLAVLEISLSFDNAVVNAKLLGRMNQFWQGLFLTVGIAIAVFGMRLIFPLLIVGLAGQLAPGAVLDLALNRPQEYEAVLRSAHTAIAAFGGVFLLMLFLDFILAERRIKWLSRLERFLVRAGRLDYLAIILVLIILAATVSAWGGPAKTSALLAGIFGLVAYLAIQGLVRLFESSRIENHQRAGLFTFIYLELLDASFSFDGVVGAFAITNQIILITIGLGIGALYIRSFTLYLTRSNVLTRYIYLEHGAHYAIGVLAILLFISMGYEIPQLVPGLLGLGFIGVAFWDSRVHRRVRTQEAIARPLAESGRGRGIS